MTLIISLAMLAIVTALGMAMYYLMTDHGPKKRTVNALILRVGLSIGLILFLIIGYFMGWIEPHGVVP